MRQNCPNLPLPSAPCLDLFSLSSLILRQKGDHFGAHRGRAPGKAFQVHLKLTLSYSNNWGIALRCKLTEHREPTCVFSPMVISSLLIECKVNKPQEGCNQVNTRLEFQSNMLLLWARLVLQFDHISMQEWWLGQHTMCIWPNATHWKVIMIGRKSSE